MLISSCVHFTGACVTIFSLTHSHLMQADHFSDSLNSTIFNYRTENSDEFRGDVNAFVDYVQTEV